MRRGSCLVASAAALVLALLLALPALAQVPQTEQRFVYGLNVFDGTEYTTGFVPPQVDALYVLADHDAVIDPKMTNVYFWPITNEYRADFTTLNDLVPGQLEVTQAGKTVATLDLTDYVLQFDPANGMGSGQLFIGDASHTAYQHFQDAKAAYLDQLRQYGDATAAYSQEQEQARSQGDTAPASPPPSEPPPLTLYSSDVSQGFPLRLPAGEYQIQERDANGQVVPDSAKRLVVVAPRRLGVGFDVVPQEKWTYPQPASDASDIVYTVPGGVAYLEPSAEQELNSVAAARLKDPQSLEGTANRWQWINVGALAPATLVVRDGDQEQQLPIQRFFVNQVPGAELGYQVVPYQPETNANGTPKPPDLTAYPVQAPDTRRSLSLRLVDDQGRQLAGSERQLAVITNVPGWQLALPVLVPLALGLSVIMWRRDQVHAARSLTPEQRQRLV
jgi:hypothetical protein